MSSPASPPPTASPQSDNRLQIKKYPNRRFYDSTRGRNLSLADLHDLIMAGYELAILDSTTNEDITNQILTQLILERHAPKLAIFPAAILHQIIRTQEQFLGSVLEQFFRMNETTATAFMMAVHEQGKGCAGIYTRDIAETKAAEVMDYAREFGMPLKVTAEPDEDDGS